MLLALPLFLVFHFLSLGIGFARAQNHVALDAVDSHTDQPIPARIEFTKSGKKLNRDRKALIAGDTWLVEGSQLIQPPPGDYEFMARRGPEFNVIHGGFTVERGTRDSILIEIPRSVDMHAENWFSGDMSAEVSSSDLARWQVADALDMAIHARVLSSKNPQTAEPKKTASAKKKKPDDAPEFTDPDLVGYRWMNEAIEFRSPDLGLAIHRLSEAHLAKTGIDAMLPEGSAYGLLNGTREDAEVLGELTQLWSRDVPILLAYPQVRCARILGIANRPKKDELLTISKQPDAPEFGKVLISLGTDRLSSPIAAPLPPQDKLRYQGNLGIGLMSESLYWLMLDAGLRIAPTAGSGFGRGDTHLGYNRVYAYCDSEPSPDAWWRAVARGATTITNGPLLRTTINAAVPGTVQASYAGTPIPLSIAVALAVREPVDYLDLVFNGETLYSAKLEDHFKKGEFPELSIDRSGWLVVRVVTAHEDGYRLATTAPYYFEFDGQPRISKRAVAFFQEWLTRSEQAIANDPQRAADMAPMIEDARRFWADRMDRSNAP